MVQRLWFALIVMTILFAAASIWTQHSSARQLEAIAVPGSRTTSVIDSVGALPAYDEDWADPRVDLNGNEIDDAVSDYRVDRGGEMYERHAPDTALLRLSAPQL